MTSKEAEVRGGAAEFVSLLNNGRDDPLGGCVTFPSEIGTKARGREAGCTGACVCARLLQTSLSLPALPIPVLTPQGQAGVNWAASAPLTRELLGGNYLCVACSGSFSSFPKLISNFSICCKNLDPTSTWRLKFVASIFIR